MIVSIAMAVLPVLRSPMISSRWPRPIGIMLSIALMPVCSGSFTGWRSAMPGALNSSGRRCGVSIAPLPSSGRPSGSTTRPISASPHGHPEQLAGPAHLVALLDAEVVAEDDDADRALFQVEDLAEGAVLELEQLAGHGVRQAVDAGDAVADLEHPADLGEVDLAAVLLDLLGDDRRDLVDSESHGGEAPRFDLDSI